MIVLGSWGVRLDSACSCLAGGGTPRFRGSQEECFKRASDLLRKYTEHQHDLYLSALPADQSSLLGHWQRSGHNPGNKARPSQWPQRHVCSPSSVPHMCSGRVWPSCHLCRVRPVLSNLQDESPGSTPHSKGHGWHLGGGTLPLTLPPNESDDQGC